MKQNYNDCLTRLLKDEGGYTNDPNDSGGPTNYGITIADYRAYINKNGAASDVRSMTVDQAKVIYKSKYWDALGCDDLSSGVDYTCFDYGVNSGLGRPRKALQRFNSLSGTKLIDAINDERTAFLQAIGQGKNSKFLKGWMARVSRVRAYSKQLATQKNITTGPVVGTATVGVGAYISQFWHNHEFLVLSVASVIAIGVAILVHELINKGK
jgi:lysozyme family protein